MFLDLFPYMAEIFAPDGTAVFFNKAGLEINKISDPGLQNFQRTDRHDAGRLSQEG